MKDRKAQSKVSCQRLQAVAMNSVGTPNPTWVGVECEKSQWSPSDLGI